MKYHFVLWNKMKSREGNERNEVSNFKDEMDKSSNTWDVADIDSNFLFLFLSTV